MSIKEYMKKYEIKSEKTVYNHVKQGKIKLVKDETGKNIVILLQNENKKNIKYIENKEIEICKQEIQILKNEIQKLENEIKYLEYKLNGKDQFIKVLEKENTEKRDDIIRLHTQIEMMNKKELLLLETQEQQNKRKKWFGIF
ncbi:hypothetical protein [Oceanivirga salmonicida]|uniref:hypothetical protein n=1 Tax=Oceanivirga salmonicida TaxID=1769291 RepID=UPI0012E2B9D3|nr:hypothetical protein [Oceanivirga salmonicida]